MNEEIKKRNDRWNKFYILMPIIVTIGIASETIIKTFNIYGICFILVTFMIILIYAYDTFKLESVKK